MEKVMDFEFGEEIRFQITKWCKSITDSGEDETVATKPEELEHKFRLLDDGNVYAYGYSSDNSTFVPLDYYQGAYGCTEIQYYENGKWETL